MEKAIVLLSGGLDSCVAASIAIKEYDPYFLHINYKQRTDKKELQSFNNIAEYYGCKNRLIIDLDYLQKIGGSSLTDMQIEVGQGSVDKKTLPNTYVPFRNANMLSIAVSWGEVINAKKIFIGAVEEDSSGYPDCRQEFYDKFNELLKVGISSNCKLQIETPLINYRKSEIVKMAIILDAPIHLTWSCYKNEDKACGECDSCLLRLRGFEEAGFSDPIEYEDGKLV